MILGRPRALFTGVAFVGMTATLSAAVRAQDVTRQVAPDGETCTTCLRLTEVVALGDTAVFGDSDAILEETPIVVVDGRGSFWIGQSSSYKVFDSTGVFVREVGRSGQGPGEFGQWPYPAFTDVEGNVHIVDTRNTRESVFSPGGDLLRDYRLAVMANAAAPLAAADRRVVSAVAREGQGFGPALHILVGEELLASFDPPAPADRPVDLRRVIATTPSGDVLSTPRYEYEITRWAKEGRLIEVFEGPMLHEEPVPNGVLPYSRGPLAGMRALHSTHDRFWVIREVAAEDWRVHVRPQRAPDGTMGFRITGNAGELWDQTVEVIDMSSGRMLASQRFDENLIGFLGDGLVYGIRYGPAGVPQIVIHRIEFAPGG